MNTPLPEPVGKHIGFTGSRTGMTAEQAASVSRLLYEYHPDDVHHGDCVGADAMFDQLVRQFRSQTGMDTTIVVHPPSEPFLQAHTGGDVLRTPKPYLERNRDIVDECDLLIATPKDTHPVLRSGTWSTIRYALKVGKKVLVIVPSGVVG